MLNARRPTVDRKRAGFTLFEFIVALAIIAIMAGVMLPSLSSRLRASNSAALTQNFKTINDALQKYRENVGYYPSQLLQLTTRPTIGNTSSCGITLSTTDVNFWKGPYLTLGVTTNGIAAGDMLISNTLVRLPGNTTSSTVMDGELDIYVSNVPDKVAFDVDAALDASGGTSTTTGVVRYTSTTGILGFAIPISGC